MILVFSKSANESPQIEREVERAVNKEVYIIPFRIDDITPSKNLEYFISNSQWMDAYSPPLERHLGNLAKTIKAVLANPPLPEPVDINAPVNEPAKRKSHLNFDAFTPVGRTGPVADGSTAHISSRLRMAIIARSHFRAVAECYLHQQYRERNNIAVFNNVVSNFDPDYNTLSAHSSRSIQHLNIERQANVDLSAAAKSTALTKYKETN